MDCSFCNLSKIGKQKFFETDKESIIYNRWAATEGQCLIIPKRHVSNIRELHKGELISLIETVQIVSKILNARLKPAGFNYGFNENLIAGQHFDHLHFHIIPRFDNDGIDGLLPKPRIPKKLTDYELELQVNKYKSFFKQTY